jgi:hypothetical protein
MAFLSTLFLQQKIVYIDLDREDVPREHRTMLRQLVPKILADLVGKNVPTSTGFVIAFAIAICVFNARNRSICCYRLVDDESVSNPKQISTNFLSKRFSKSLSGRVFITDTTMTSFKSRLKKTSLLFGSSTMTVTVVPVESTNETDERKIAWSVLTQDASEKEMIDCLLKLCAKIMYYPIRDVVEKMCELTLASCK